jgi:hypothetical protein
MPGNANIEGDSTIHRLREVDSSHDKKGSSIREVVSGPPSPRLGRASRTG